MSKTTVDYLEIAKRNPGVDLELVVRAETELAKAALTGAFQAQYLIENPLGTSRMVMQQQGQRASGLLSQGRQLGGSTAGVRAAAPEPTRPWQQRGDSTDL